MAENVRKFRNRAWIAAVVGWPVLVAVNYFLLWLANFDLLAFPFGGLLLLGMLAACWIWALTGSVVVVVQACRRRAHVWAVGCLVASVIGAVGVVKTDWERTFVDTQFSMHRGAFKELGDGFRAGRLGTHTRLPWSMRYLSIDGRAHVRDDDALYVPVWEDWRAESGIGYGYFPTPPGPDTEIRTATGDIGKPVRPLGDGWWWVE